MPKRALTNKEFDARLAFKNPRIIRVDNYINTQTKIKFKCLVHNEVHSATPKNCLLGEGLSCCRASQKRRELAAISYDKKLNEKNPKIIRIGRYLKSTVKIEFKCLIHNEIHLARPKDCLNGSGLLCCGRVNTFYHSIKFGKQLTELYLSPLSRFSNYVKIGISNNTDKRKDREYGKPILLKKFNSRLEAFALEQAILQDSTLTRDCPEEMYLNKWPGWTEVRKCGRETAKKTVETYITELESIGINRFAKKYFTLTRTEKALLDKNFPSL